MLYSSDQWEQIHKAIDNLRKQVTASVKENKDLVVDDKVTIYPEAVPSAPDKPRGYTARVRAVLNIKASSQE